MNEGKNLLVLIYVRRFLEINSSSIHHIGQNEPKLSTISLFDLAIDNTFRGEYEQRHKEATKKCDKCATNMVDGEYHAVLCLLGIRVPDLPRFVLAPLMNETGLETASDDIVDF